MPPVQAQPSEEDVDINSGISQCVGELEVVVVVGVIV